MTYDPDRHHRRSIRLRNYDYRQAGAYFVTICAQDRDCLFGDVVDGEMQLNLFGAIVAACWGSIPRKYRYVTLDKWVVMPNHFHGIIVIHELGGDAGKGHPGDVGAGGGGGVGVDGGSSGTDGGGSRGKGAAADWDCGGYSGRADAADWGDPGYSGEAAAAMGVADPRGRSAAAWPLRLGVGGYGVLRYDQGVRGTKAGSLGAIIQNFKSLTTRRINAARRLNGHNNPVDHIDPVGHINSIDHIDPVGRGRGQAAAEYIAESATNIAAAASPLEPSDSATPIAAAPSPDNPRSSQSAAAPSPNHPPASGSAAPIWQRNYYEHIVRDEVSLDRIRSYIASNPASWDLDDQNPDKIADSCPHSPSPSSNKPV